MNIGDHLVTPRTGYTHHGLYIGMKNGKKKVIHYTGFTDGMSSGKIAITSLKKFRNGHEVYVKDHFFRRYDAEESVERAYERLGEDWYNVLLNNCEHFVNWCINGLHESGQVNGAIAAIAATYAIQKYAEQDVRRQTVRTAASFTARRLVEKEVTRQATQTIASGMAKSVMSASAGTAAGMATSTGLASYGTGAAIATGVISASSATVLLPAAAAIAVGAAVWSLFDD